jgi:hypothetical protein
MNFFGSAKFQIFVRRATQIFVSPAQDAVIFNKNFFDDKHCSFVPPRKQGQVNFGGRSFSDAHEPFHRSTRFP